VVTPAPATLDALVADLEAEHLDLDRLVADLDEPEWNTATPAEGWAVRDAISHLAFFDDAAVMAMTDPEAFTAMAQAAVAAGGDPMAEHLRQGREMSAHDLLLWWRTARATLIGEAAKLDPKVRVPWFGPPMGTLSFVSARLMETWAHGQDVADALGTTRLPTARLRHIAHIGVHARPYAYIVRGLERPTVRVAVELTGPGGEHWAWDDDVSATDAVRGDALDFCLVVTQRRNIADTTLELVGDAAKDWMAIAQAFAGPPSAGRPPLGDAVRPR
jgi:uncharacterized protein (TIGR03084 family)